MYLRNLDEFKVVYPDIYENVRDLSDDGEIGRATFTDDPNGGVAFIVVNGNNLLVFNCDHDEPGDISELGWLENPDNIAVWGFDRVTDDGQLIERVLYDDYLILHAHMGAFLISVERGSDAGISHLPGWTSRSKGSLPKRNRKSS